MAFEYYSSIGVFDLNIVKQALTEFVGTEDHRLCASRSRNADICFGDSGGPLMYKSSQSGRYYEVGIVSGFFFLQMFHPCTSAETPGLYSTINELRPFIMQNAPATCVKGYDE